MTYGELPKFMPWEVLSILISTAVMLQCAVLLCCVHTVFCWWKKHLVFYWLLRILGSKCHLNINQRNSVRNPKILMHGFSLCRRLVERIPCDAVLRSPGKLDILQEGNLKCIGAAYPHVPKEKPAGKKTSLAKYRVLASVWGKKESVSPWEKWAGNLRGLQRFCGVIWGDN